MSATAVPGPIPAPGGAATSPGDIDFVPHKARPHGAQRQPGEPGRRPRAEPQDIAEALASTHNLARQQAEAGDLTGARTLLEDALAAAELQLGHDHPWLAPLMVELAMIARGLGNLTEALTQLKRAYAIISASGGPEHAASLSIEGRLAAIMYRLGEPTEAYDWHLADVGARVLGADHPAVRGAQQRLATVHPEPEPEAPSAAGQTSVPDLGQTSVPDLAGQTSVPDPDPDWEPGLAPTYADIAAPSPPYDEGSRHHGEGHHGEGHHGEGRHTEGRRDEGRHTEGHHTEGHHNEGDHESAPTNKASYPQETAYYRKPPHTEETAHDSMHPRAAYDASRTPDAQATVYTETAPGVFQRQQQHPPGMYIVNPPTRDYQDADLWREPPPALERPRRRRTYAGGIALIASLAAGVVATAVIVGAQFVVPMADTNAAATPPAPTITAPAPATPAVTTATTPPAPTAVTLKDNGNGSVTITWVDPSDGKVPFIVAGGRAGTVQTPVESVPPGRTTSTIYGLNAGYNYCYTVAAVWSADMIVPSMRTCTHRTSATPSA